jgi:hypothetical protein
LTIEDWTDFSQLFKQFVLGLLWRLRLVFLGRATARSSFISLFALRHLTLLSVYKVYGLVRSSPPIPFSHFWVLHSFLDDARIMPNFFIVYIMEYQVMIKKLIGGVLGGLVMLGGIAEAESKWANPAHGIAKPSQRVVTPAPMSRPQRPVVIRPKRPVSLPTKTLTIPFQTIDMGYTPLHEQFSPQPQVFIFTNRATWEQFWQSIRILDLNLQKPPAPQFDFERRTLIGVTSGSRSTGGYALQVDKIEVVGDSWVLHYTELVPGRNCLVTTAPTTPSAFIAVEVPVLPIKLQGKTVSRDCW